MKRIILIGLLIGWFSPFIFAQNFTTQVSEMSVVGRAGELLDAWKVDKYIYSVVREKGDLTIKIYESGSLKLLSSRIFFDNSCKDNPDCLDNDEFTYEGVQIINKKMIFFFSSMERKTKEYMLFAQYVDATGHFLGKMKIVDKIQAQSRSNAGSYVVKPSADSTQFVVITHPPFEKGKRNQSDEEFSFKVYDSNLNNLSDMKTKLSFKDKNVEFQDYVLSNDGKLNILTKVTLEKKEKERGSAPHFYMIYVFDTKNNITAEFKLDLPKRNIESVAIKLNKQSTKLYCTGIYSELKDRQYTGNDFDGLFFMSIDSKTMSIISTKVNPFDKKTVADLLSSGTKELSDKKKKKVEDDQGISKSYYIKDFYVNLDESARVVLERYYVTSYTSCDSKGNCHTTYVYHYDDLLFANFDSNGDLIKMRKMLKGSGSADGGMYLSYFLLESGNKSYVIFNDNTDNINLDGNTKEVSYLGNLKKAALVGAELTENGTGPRKEIVRNETAKFMSMPKKAIRIADGEYIVPVIAIPKNINTFTLLCTCGCISFFYKHTMGLMKISAK